MNRTKGFLLSFIGLLMVIASLCIADSETSYRIYLTADAKDEVPQDSPADSFDCRSKIYIVFEGTLLRKGRHTLEAIWKNPNGKKQEHTAYQFEAAKEKENIWLWIELHPSFGGKLFGAIGHSLGVENFIGRWIVKLYLDGNFLEKKTFYVIC